MIDAGINEVVMIIIPGTGCLRLSENLKSPSKN